MKLRNFVIAIAAFALAFALGAAPAFADEATYTVSGSTTGGGSVVLVNGSTQGSVISAHEGDTITVSCTMPAGSYVAQVRYAQQAIPASTGSEATFGTYTALPLQTGYSFTMPAANVSVVADYVSIVWDGTIDVSWYDPTSQVFRLQYAAQYAGLAAIVNGIFTAYPTATVIDDKGTGATHEAPDYASYLATMGAVTDENAAITGSNLYGEFAATYKLTDSQTGDYESRTEAISVVQRVVGPAQYVEAHCSSANDTGGPNGQNLTTTSDYWYGSDDFDGKVVYITADLDFGGTHNVDGTWSTSSPLFMPVSGQYSMLPGLEKTNAYAKLSSSWNGTLDGLGHAFKNVYCERYANTEFGDAQSVGLVGRLGNHDGDYETWKSSEGKDGNYPAVNPTVRQIVLESGYISSRRSIGSIVGKIGHTSATELKDGTTGGIVEYCINKADVVGTDKKGIGGIVGAAWNNGVIRSCANFGSVTCRTYGSGFVASGIAGTTEMPIVNCYNVGTIFAGKEGSTYSEAIGTDNGGATWSNCYYLAGSDGNTTYPGVYKGTGAETVLAFGSGQSITALSASLLNNGDASVWKDDTTGINAKDGVNYPVLYFQQEAFDPETTYSVTLTQPTEGGTFSASATSAPYATTITLSCQPTAGWALDHYEVNGTAIEGDSFLLEGDSTVTAVFRVLATATLTINCPEDADWVLAVHKNGVIVEDGAMVEVTDYPVENGDTVYEGDTLIYLPEIKEGAAPSDVDKCYTGEFVMQTLYPNYPETTSSSTANPYTVSSSDTNLCVSVNTAKTAYKSWATMADTSWYDAEEPADAYTLTTAEQLAGLAKLVNDGVDFEGVAITLGADISLANTDGTSGIRNWSPIGYNASAPFKGTFDGAGHTVSDLCIANSVSGAVSTLRGLFGATDGATIENVTISGSIVGASSNVCGGIVAQASNATTVKDCTSHVAVTGTASKVGGIVGSMTGTADQEAAALGQISGCTFNGTLEGAGASGQAGVGGIAGVCSYGAIESCLAKGTVSLTSGSNGSLGGIVGYLTGANVKGCVNQASLAYGASSGYAGGIAGYASAATAENVSSIALSLNQGDISGTASYAAGIIGYATGACPITDSASVGAISTTKTSGYAAGIIGYATNAATATVTTFAEAVSNSYAAGTLSAANTGTIAGYYVKGVLTTQNVHHLEGLASSAYAKKGASALSDPTATSQSESALKELTSTLGEWWSGDAIGLNGGNPIPTATQALLLNDARPSGVATGDVNQNGKINIVDAQIAYDIACGLHKDNEGYAQLYALAEVTGDNIVDAADAFAIQYAVHNNGTFASN